MTTISQIAKYGSNQAKAEVVQGITELYAKRRISRKNAIAILRLCGADMLADFINIIDNE